MGDAPEVGAEGSHTQQLCINPSSNGGCSGGVILSFSAVGFAKVSILLLMDDAPEAYFS